MTQLEYAKDGVITPLVKKVSRLENISPRLLSKYIKDGRVVIPSNNTRALKKPCAIGYSLRTKVNANLGTSTDKSRLKDEIRKLEAAVKYGADAVMDLSVGLDIKRIRKEILKRSPVPVGTVPVYEIAVQARKNKRDFLFSA